MAQFRIDQSTLALIMMMTLSLSVVSCKHPTAAPPVAVVVPPPPNPAPPAPAPTITLTAAPATIDRGQSTTLVWEARNASLVSIVPELGAVAITGNRQVSPQSSVTYTATATGPGGTAPAVTRVTVNIPAPPVPTATRATTPRTTVATATAPPLSAVFDQTMLPVYFDYDRSEIRASETGRLNSIVAWLKQNPNLRFTIGGHADDRGSQEYNLALGDRRANAVRAYLISNGVADSRIVVTSFGEERPMCREQNEACWSKNRRGAFTMN